MMGTLSEIAKFSNGKRKSNRVGRIPVYGGNGIFDYTDEPNSNNCVIIGRVGAYCGSVHYEPFACWVSDNAIRCEARPGSDIRFLYYLLKSLRLDHRQIGTSQPLLTQSILNAIELDNIPNLKLQHSIASLLWSFDEKIKLNQQTNDYLVDLATALFEKALDEETCLIPFGELAELEDSKRIPLNKQDREKRKGPYPYYGATSIMDYVDDYLFDDIRVLLGEDGSVMTDEGYPFLQYVWGKYWVNNHAHIIKAKSDYSLEALYLALRRTAINHIVTGAVQMKISQKNLNGLELQMPNLTTIPDFGPFFAMYRHNTDEAKRLAKLRDILLPKMMSGEIDVSKISIHWEESFE